MEIYPRVVSELRRWERGEADHSSSPSRSFVGGPEDDGPPGVEDVGNHCDVNGELLRAERKTEVPTVHAS